MTAPTEQDRPEREGLAVACSIVKLLAESPMTGTEDATLDDELQWLISSFVFIDPDPTLVTRHAMSLIAELGILAAESLRVGWSDLDWLAEYRRTNVPL